MTTATPPPQLKEYERRLLLNEREALLLRLRAIEDVLGLPQSQPTRDERREQRHGQRA